MTVLSPSDCRDMMLSVCGRIVENEAKLNELDRKTGNGGHGSTMAKGFSAAAEVLKNLDPADVSEVFKRTGMALLSAMSGASGIVFSCMILGGVMNPPPELGELDALDGEKAAILFRRSLEVIKSCGGAAVLGEKTMLDALEPAVSALETTNGPLPARLDAAAKAAEAGFEATREMNPKSSLTRTIHKEAPGEPDPGAGSVAVIFAAMRDFVRAK